MEKVILSVSLIIFSVPVGFAVLALIRGKLPAIGGNPRNYVVWGDKNVDPYLLTGKRARFVALFMGGFFSLCALSIYTKGVGESISVVIGLIIGFVMFRWALTRA